MPAKRRSPPRKGRTGRTGRTPVSPAAPEEQASLLEQTEARITEIRTRYAEVQKEYYQIGKLILALDRREVLELYGLRSFREFVSTHIVAYSTAQRFMLVAENYDEETAVDLGIEKGFQLARLVRADPAIRSSAMQLVARDARLGKARKKISKLSAKEIKGLVENATMRSGKTEAPKATRKEKAAVKRLGSVLGEQLELESVDVDIDPKKRTVVVTLSLDEVAEAY